MIATCKIEVRKEEVLKPSTEQKSTNTSSELDSRFSGTWVGNIGGLNGEQVYVIDANAKTVTDMSSSAYSYRAHVYYATVVSSTKLKFDSILSDMASGMYTTMTLQTDGTIKVTSYVFGSPNGSYIMKKSS